MTPNWLLTCALPLFILPVPAMASVPPMNWRPAVYQGPGLFCSGKFKFIMKSGEVAVPAWPSELSEAINFKSHGGAFTFIWESNPAPIFEKQKIISNKDVTIYLITKVIQSRLSGLDAVRRYWFETSYKESFRLDFYPAVSGQGGWGDFPASEYESVISRVSFDQSDQDDTCLRSLPNSKPD